MTADRLRILVFFLLSYAFTWFGHLGNWLLPSSAWPRPMNPFGPILAAILIILVTGGRAGLARWLRRIVRFRAPLRIYAAASAIPTLIILVSVALAVTIGTPVGSLPVFAPLELVLLIPLVLIDGPALEEPAFRGFAQHELQQTLTPLAASLWIGSGVLIWHLPVLVLGLIPWPIAFAIVAVSVVYAWLYRAGGSIWPLIVLHFVQNAVGGEYFGQMFAASDGAVWVGFLSVFYIGWAAILVWRLGPSLGAPLAVAELRTEEPEVRDVRLEEPRQIPASLEPWTCPNCACAVHTPFCAACGERPLRPTDLTMPGLFAQLLRHFTTFDGRFLNTVRTLMVRPGELTRAFQQGRRKPFLGPLQVFVLANVLFFAIQSMSDLRVFAPTLEMQLLDEPWSEVAKTLVDRHLAEADTSLAAYAAVYDQAVAVNAKSLIGSMVVPFALCLLLTFWRAARPFSVHLAFSLHFYAFMLLLFCVPAIAIAAEAFAGGAALRSQPADDVFSLLLLVACAGYLYLAVGNAYGTRGVRRAFQTGILVLAMIAVLFCYRLFLLPFTLFTT